MVAKAKLKKTDADGNVYIAKPRTIILDDVQNHMNSLFLKMMILPILVPLISWRHRAPPIVEAHVLF